MRGLDGAFVAQLPIVECHLRQSVDEFRLYLPDHIHLAINESERALVIRMTGVPRRLEFEHRAPIEKVKRE
jgi:hypothetical protein